jgi:hypothetical protein
MSFFVAGDDDVRRPAGWQEPSSPCVVALFTAETGAQQARSWKRYASGRPEPFSIGRGIGSRRAWASFG